VTQSPVSSALVAVKCLSLYIHVHALCCVVLHCVVSCVACCVVCCVACCVVCGMLCCVWCVLSCCVGCVVLAVLVVWCVDLCSVVLQCARLHCAVPAVLHVAL